MANEPIEPSLIPNTTMVKYINSSGRWVAIKITPNEGYCLHDKGYDYPIVDPETGEETGEIVRGYCAAVCSCGYNYDFTQTTIIDGYTAYGISEYFARPISEVSSNQLFNNGNDHEVM